MRELNMVIEINNIGDFIDVLRIIKLLIDIINVCMIFNKKKKLDLLRYICFFVIIGCKCLCLLFIDNKLIINNFLI